MTDRTYQRQKLWNDHRKSKLERSTAERDQKTKEENTFKPKINHNYRNVQSRLLNSTNSTRNSSYNRSTKPQLQRNTKSSSSRRRTTRTTNNNNNNNNNNNLQKNTSPTASSFLSNSPTTNTTTIANNSNNNQVFDLSAEEPDEEDEEEEEDDDLSSVSSADMNEEEMRNENEGNDDRDDPRRNDSIASDVHGINPPQTFTRQTSTGISLHVARQRQARLRKEEIKSGKAYRTKRAALNARPFNLSTTNARLHNNNINGSNNNNGNNTGNGSGLHGLSVADPSLIGIMGTTTAGAFNVSGSFGNNSSSVTDADIRNMIREHRNEIQEIRQDTLLKTKLITDKARESQEDALIRQEVALRRLFDDERKAWHNEKTQLMTLVGSLQREIAERAEARSQAESMARSLSNVVSTLEKRLLQVEQGAQDEIRKLRAALASGGVGGSSGGVSSGSSNRGLRNLGTELASGVRKLMRGHENNVRSLFAGREEAAMRQTEGLRVHVESTVEQSEERLSALVEHSTDVSSTLNDVNENVTHLMTMMSKWRKEQQAQMSKMESIESMRMQMNRSNANEDVDGVEGRSRKGSVVPPTPPRSATALGLQIPVKDQESEDEKYENEDEDDDRIVESITPPAEEQWIRVPGEDGNSFYYGIVDKQLWKGEGIPPNVIEAPSLDSPMIPPRKE